MRMEPNISQSSDIAAIRCQSRTLMCYGDVNTPAAVPVVWKYSTYRSVQYGYMTLGNDDKCICYWLHIIYAILFIFIISVY
jgi:hypothetical protein